ncbi:hypothetical protein D7D52_22075 [Nocardia yunnanensis]|uniref:Uncharacterized protein n=1 Tax=Nocardia yunnanensis TaxID=2382165 RepID=A0A386ZHN9_9NOCA|nr:hypothetical protein [Nocardia yunnanensis]AYF76079.1 hypothetical protein D7D52_22075 [Nocardia yunnanensis]
MSNKRVREKAQEPGMGVRRVERYTAAFDWVIACLESGHFLEAVAVLDSLIGDRLASRFSYLRKEQPLESMTVGGLSEALLNGYAKKSNPVIESDPQFRAVIEDILAWSKARNNAIHATAKIFGNDDLAISFADGLIVHRDTAVQGVHLLQQFDVLDTAARAVHDRVPGTYPNAFFPDNRPRWPRR